MKSEMTHRERILAAINHQPTDRVPMDFWGVPEITERLMLHFGVSDLIGLAKALDIDMIMVIEPPLKPGRRNMWDIEMKKVPLLSGAGYYEEPVRHPIGGFETIGEIEAHYVWPTTDMFDYSGVKSQCKMYREEGFAIEGGYISLTYYYEMVRGIEQMLYDMVADEELAAYVFYKINEFASNHMHRILEEADGLVDIVQVTDDLGTQQGLMFSLKMIEQFLGKYYDENVELGKAYNAKVFHHNDGAIFEAIPWVIDKGCQILNPLQWHLPGWDIDVLKKEYGKQLCFHGGIDNQHVMPFGSVEDVKTEVKTCIDALYSDRTGYILAPCHRLQSITQIENIITMYDYAREYSLRI